jgi:hypothetical protein
MNEIFPMLAGVVVGLVLGAMRPSLRLRIGFPLAIGLGITATVISGEFKVGWEYLLIDIPLVALSAACTLLATRYVARRLTAGGRGPGRPA